MILRNAIIAIALLGLALCVIGALGDSRLWPMVLGLGCLVAALLFERNRYQERLKLPSKDGLRPTDERFIDPESGRPVRVWLDPSGKRLYLDETGGGPG
jgi:hypothetical protein